MAAVPLWPTLALSPRLENSATIVTHARTPSKNNRARRHCFPPPRRATHPQWAGSRKRSYHPRTRLQSRRRERQDRSLRTKNRRRGTPCLFVAQQAAGNCLEPRRSGRPQNAAKSAARISGTRVPGRKFGVLSLRPGLSDQRRRLCRCDVEELGKYRAGLSRQSKRNVNSARSRALGKGNWREDANASSAGCNTRPRRELLVRSADAQLEKRRDAEGTVQGKASGRKSEARCIGTAHSRRNSARTLPAAFNQRSGSFEERAEGPQRKKEPLKVRLSAL